MLGVIYHQEQRKNGYVKRLVERMADCSLCVFSLFCKFPADILIFLDYHSGRSLMISYSIGCWQLRKLSHSATTPAYLLPAHEGVSACIPPQVSRPGLIVSGSQPLRHWSWRRPSASFSVSSLRIRTLSPFKLPIFTAPTGPRPHQPISGRPQRDHPRQCPSTDLILPPANSMSDSILAQAFYTEFQAARNGPSPVSPDFARYLRLVVRLTPISDYSTRLSTAASSHTPELSARLATLRKQFVDARSFLPPYDQRQYETVQISLDPINVIIDDALGITATKVVGTRSRETADEPVFCRCQTKVRIQAEG